MEDYAGVILVLSISLICVSTFAIKALFVIDRLREENHKLRIELLPNSKRA